MQELEQIDKMLWSIVHKIYAKNSFCILEKDDLYQVAKIAALAAIKNFDKNRSVGSSYIYRSVYNEVVRFMLANKGYIHIPKSKRQTVKIHYCSLVRGNYRRTSHSGYSNKGYENSIEFSEKDQSDFLALKSILSVSKYQKIFELMFLFGYNISELSIKLKTSKQRLHKILKEELINIRYIMA